MNSQIISTRIYYKPVAWYKIGVKWGLLSPRAGRKTNQADKSWSFSQLATTTTTMWILHPMVVHNIDDEHEGRILMAIHSSESNTGSSWWLTHPLWIAIVLYSRENTRPSNILALLTQQRIATDAVTYVDFPYAPHWVLWHHEHQVSMCLNSDQQVSLLTLAKFLQHQFNTTASTVRPKF